MFGIWMFIIYKMYTIWKQMYRYYILFGYYSNYPNQAKLRENWVEWRNENSRGILIRWASGQVSFSSGTRINSIPIVSGEIYRLLGGSCSTHGSHRYRSEIVYNTVSMLLHCAAAFHASEGLFKFGLPILLFPFVFFGPRILIRCPFKWKLMPG